MNRLFPALSLVVAGLLLSTGCATTQTHFGQPMKLTDQKPLTVTHIVTDPNEYEGRYVAVRGTVRSLCTHSGCWMELAHNPSDEADGLLVIFTYDRKKYRVPPEAKGHEALVEGTVVIKESSEAQRRYRAKEQGMSAEQVAAIVGPKKSVRLECPAARIAGVKPGTPQACEHEKSK